MPATAKAPASVGDVVVFNRLLDAPRSAVFRAWTDPKELAQWWGPKGFTNPVCEADPRPGGAIRIVMRGPDGTDYPMGGAFIEVVAPERIVFSATVDLRGVRVLETHNTVTLVEQGGKTVLELRVRVVHATAEATPMLAGMHEGWSQSLGRLGAFAGRR
ncbi:MAG: SRPBCC domain-containing protein [Xanthobacteraceae bacterium]|nr:SRPBCC domain-containing protein [Xanthobacteraceae bacterium]